MLWLAWCMYFGLWISSIVFYDKMLKNNKITYCMLPIALLDVVYLFARDPKGIVLVILATLCAMIGILRIAKPIVDSKDRRIAELNEKYDTLRTGRKIR